MKLDDILQQAFYHLNLYDPNGESDIEKAKELFQSALEIDETNGDAAFGLFVCITDSRESNFGTIVNVIRNSSDEDAAEMIRLLKIAAEHSKMFDTSAQKILDGLNAPEEFVDEEDLDLYNKLNALTDKAKEFDEIFDAFQNSSGKLQDRLIENRANEMMEEMQNIADSFTDDDVYKIQNAVLDEDDLEEQQADNHIENKVEEILDTVRENYLNGELNPAEAFDLFYQMAEMRNAEAMTTVAFMFSVGEGIEENINEAIYWYRRAAELNYSDAMCNLGFLYIYGKDIPRNYEKGLKWIHKAVALENSQAMCALAECYLNGWGVEENHDTAFDYYEQSANLGNQGAMMVLGMMTLNEDDKHFDREKSQELFRKAVEDDFLKKPKCYPVGNEILEYYRGERRF